MPMCTEDTSSGWDAGRQLLLEFVKKEANVRRSYTGSVVALRTASKLDGRCGRSMTIATIWSSECDRKSTSS